ncbi:hypothetical protein CDD81_611 [Ophiocordyceps australis]|uniref:AH domain-containing protein n=1 Tax=Ophiocordyceps australis TaxID=1399860 RepID=A0A2C5YEF8_9HYPO|nr:hypothetical protein CDD81_611 [Ophiocordyceps australis]
MRENRAAYATTPTSILEQGEQLGHETATDVDIARILSRLDKLEKNHLESNHESLAETVSDLLNRQHCLENIIESLTCQVETFCQKTVGQTHDFIYQANTMATEADAMLKKMQNLKDELQAQTSNMKQGLTDCQNVLNGTDTITGVPSLV